MDTLCRKRALVNINLFLKRLALFALVFSFITNPVFVVFAQEASVAADVTSTTSESLPDATISDVEPNSVLEDVAGELDAEKIIEEGIQPEELTEEDLLKNIPEEDLSLQSMSLMSGGQSAGVKFQIPTQKQATVDQSTGALVYEYPIELPTGRAGLTPELSVKYNSRNISRPDSYVGLGWDLSVPYIMREPLRGTNNLYSKGYFSSSLSGNLIATTDTSSSQYTLYRPEVDDGEYLKYTYNSNNTWTVTDKSGKVYVFGENASARQDDPADSTKVYKWMLSKITDINGNEIRYSYMKDSGQIYPSQISYTHHPQSPGIHTVDFSYTTPSGYGSTIYNSVFPVRTYKLLNSIVVTTTVGADITTDTYNFQYQDAQFIKQKLLSFVDRNYNMANFTFNQNFTDRINFSYSTKTPGWQTGTHSVQNFLQNIDDSIYEDVFNADFDKNGYQDILISNFANNNLYNYLLLNNGNDFTESATSWSLPNNDIGVYYAVVDVNGDKLPDLHPRWYSGSSGQGSVFLNTGFSFVEDTVGAWEMINSAPEASCGPNVGDNMSLRINSFLYDMNGDEKNDIVWFGGTGVGNFKVYLNNGNGWTQSSNYTFTPNSGASFTITPGCGGPLSNDYQTLIDVNGDGLSDYYHQQYGTYLNTGSGFAYNANYTINISELGRSGFADLNGDGLLDYVASVFYGGSNICVNSYLNNGNGFTKVFPNTSPCGSGGIWNAFDLSFSNISTTWGTLLDINSDNYPDIIGPSVDSSLGRVRSISNGLDSWTINPITGDQWQQIVSPNYGFYLDINSDGILDWTTPNTSLDGAQVPASKVLFGKLAIPNRLTTITSALGAQTDISYSTNSTNYSNTDISPMSVVSRISVGNMGLGQPDMVKSYAYDKGSYYTNPQTGQKRFAGFHKVTVTESGSNLSPIRISETYFHQANGSDAPTSEPADNHPGLIGRPYYSVVKHPAGTSKKENWNKYALFTLTTEPVTGRDSKFVYQTENINKTTDASTSVATAEVYVFNTSLGEQTELRSMGFVNAGAGGTYTDITGDTRYKFTEYANNVQNTLVKPKRVDIRTSPTATLHRTDYFYDGQAHGVMGSLGNLTRETKWISGNGTTTASTNYTYDAFGNVLTVANPRNATTTYTYDSTKTQVATETNHLNQTTSYSYITGKPHTITDPNGRVIIYQYSNKGWPWQTTSQNTSGSQNKREYLGNYNGIWFVETNLETINTNEDRILQVFDNLGRPIRKIQRLVNHDAGTYGIYYVKEVKEYDVTGREISTSAQSSVSGGPSYYALFSSIIPSNLFTTTSYDVFDRPTAISNILGTTTLSYAGAETTTIDANGKQKKTKADAYGNLVEVKEYNGANVHTTVYKYNILNLLTKVTDALGNFRNFTYNNAGWLTSSEDLRAVGDTTFGSSSFTYDLNGNQLVETQPKGTTVTRVYDMLDRVTSINSSSTTPLDFSFIYDTCTNGKGRVCTVTGTLPDSVTLSKSYVYGISGVPTSTTLTTMGNTHTTSFQYNLSDVISKTTYPNGTVVRTAFGDWALPYQTYVTLPGGSETLFATINYHYTGQPEIINFANGTTITNVYDENKLYRKTSKIATRSGSTLSSLAYTYDNIGNITQVTEPNVRKNYTYDDLYRLTQAVHTPLSSGTATTYNYTYNAIGNITNANGQAYTYSSVNKTNPHAVTTIGSGTYAYDANGNMTSAPGRTISNNWQNMPTRITLNGTTNIDAYYDENGERFIYKTPTNTEIQVDEEYLLRNNVPEIKLKLGGNLLGTISNNSISSSITDHLGTPIKQVSSSGTILEDVTYDPYGKVLSQTGTLNTKHGYTGHEEDVDTGLVYAEARYYNPSILRFTTQDPSHIYLGHQAFNALIGVDRMQILLDPQQLNSYSYVRNNPINGTDPTGKAVLGMHGTVMPGKNSKSFNGNKNLRKNLEKDFPGQDIRFIDWSGKDNFRARRKAANELAKTIESYPENEPINVVCHSHGCNAVALYTQRSDARAINNLITYGVPARKDGKFNQGNITNHLNIYDGGDIVQISGGGNLTATGVIAGAVGAFLCGICAVGTFAIGSVVGWGEFGVAGRKIQGAQNFNTKDYTTSGFLNVHSEIYDSQSVWDSLISPNLTK